MYHPMVTQRPAEGLGVMAVVFAVPGDAVGPNGELTLLFLPNVVSGLAGQCGAAAGAKGDVRCA